MKLRVWKRWAGRVGGIVLAANLVGLLGCVSGPEAPGKARGASSPPPASSAEESGGESLILRPEGLAQEKAAPAAGGGYPEEVTERLNKAREAFRRQQYQAAEDLFAV